MSRAEQRQAKKSRRRHGQLGQSSASPADPSSSTTAALDIPSPAHTDSGSEEEVATPEISITLPEEKTFTEEIDQDIMIALELEGMDEAEREINLAVVKIIEFLEKAGEWGFNHLKVLRAMAEKEHLTLSQLTTIAAGYVTMGTRAGERNVSNFTRSQMRSFTDMNPGLPVWMFTKAGCRQRNTSGAGMVAATAPLLASVIESVEAGLTSVLADQFGNDSLPFMFFCHGMSKGLTDTESLKNHAIWLIGNAAVQARINIGLRAQQSEGKMLDRTPLQPKLGIEMAVARKLNEPMGNRAAWYGWCKNKYEDLWAPMSVYPDFMTGMLTQAGVNLDGKTPVDMAAFLNVCEAYDLDIQKAIGGEARLKYQEAPQDVKEVRQREGGVPEGF